jgi:hypothetical protein
MSTTESLKHGIAVRRRSDKKLVQFIPCEVGTRALRILSGRRHNLDTTNYRAEEEFVKQSEVEGIEA